MKSFSRKVFLCVLVSFWSLTAGETPQISPEEVKAAQTEWGEAIVNIGASDKPKQEAIKWVEKLYDFDEGGVLFKPTRAKEVAFRTRKDEALSYFVKGSIAEDQGFALSRFKNVRFENSNIFCQGNIALAMGNYYFTQPDNTELKVEYSFVYVKDQEGNIKIKLHHSSIPFSG